MRCARLTLLLRSLRVRLTLALLIWLRLLRRSLLIRLRLLRRSLLSRLRRTLLIRLRLLRRSLLSRLSLLRRPLALLLTRPALRPLPPLLLRWRLLPGLALRSRPPLRSRPLLPRRSPAPGVLRPALRLLLHPPARHVAGREIATYVLTPDLIGVVRVLRRHRGVDAAEEAQQVAQVAAEVLL